VEQAERQQFLITADHIDLDRTHSLTLRVDREDFLPHADGGVGLSPAGGTTTEGQRLSGMRLLDVEGNPQALVEALTIPPDRLGGLLNKERWLADLYSLAEAQFLDSIAQGGGGVLRYDKAKRRLREYLDRTGRTQTVPEVLRQLRRRGHIEVRTDTRGRWIGVARVPPTLYSVPLRTGDDEFEVWGVTGTLSFAHWNSLTGLGQERRCRTRSDDPLPVIRILGALGAVGEEFTISTLPVGALLSFSLSAEDLANQWGDCGFEELQEGPAPIRQFKPQYAGWGGVDGPTNQFKWSLLLTRDPQTEVHPLYSLRSNREEVVRYRFIPDRRWGMWFAYYAAISHYFPDEAWPLLYQGDTHSVWLPAKMDVPLTIERALIAAGGGPPIELKLSRVQHGEAQGLLATTPQGVVIGPLHLFYDALLPDQRTSRWLEYQFVAPALALLVAQKLGASIHEF